MTSPVIHPGDDLAGCTVTRLIGSGGEGEVWQAHGRDGRPVALKLIRPDVLVSPDEVRRRGRWLVRIDHPAMVKVFRGGRFTGGELDGWGFVEMDLLTGHSLQDVEPVPDTLTLLWPVAEALDLLHAGAWSDGTPLIHRDVKPGNLIETPSGLVLVDPSTMRGIDSPDLTRVGTPAYLAPEVLSGRFGPRADVYSIAATAAALITGARSRQLADVIADPYQYGLPEGVCAALSPDPSRRPGTCTLALDPAFDSRRPDRRRRSGVRTRNRERDGHRINASAPFTGPDVTDYERYDDSVYDEVPYHDDVPYHDREMDPAQSGTSPRSVWPVFALTFVLVGPAVLWTLYQRSPAVVSIDVMYLGAAAVATVHLATHVFSGRAGLALFAPPWAWGSLFGRSAPFKSRRRWLADSVSGTITAAVLAVAGVFWQGFDTRLIVAATSTAVILSSVWQAASRLPKRGAFRLIWLIVWAVSLPVQLLGAIGRFFGSRY